MASKRPAYLTHLSLDKRLAPLLAEDKPILLAPSDNVWLNLTAAIMSQQLSTRVASVIRGRFIDLYGGKPEPQRVLDTPFESLRSIGLSGAKTGYVQNIARFALEEGMSFGKLQGMPDDEVITYLTQIKGVGRWTVEMTLMFTLGRPDVFAADDLGLQQAMMAIYRLSNEDKRTFREKMLKISGKWTPYRTYACMHLWRHKDGK